MTYYKVVIEPRWMDETGLSLKYFSLPKEYQRSYTPGKWTEAAQGTGLFVFTTLQAAQRNLKEGEVIWACECEGELPCPEKVVDLDEAPGFLLSVDLFWTEKLICGGSYWHTPQDTALFQRVKITKKVRVL